MTKIDVLLGEAAILPADVVGRVVIVIDVLRAATTVATALANGARGVYPFGTVEETARRGAEMDRDSVRMAGERKMVRIPGFDFGNSPLEFTSAAIAGRSVLYTTTNGTAALVATHGARACLFAGFVNVSATVRAVLHELTDGRDVTVICAGTERRAALEDIVCAGHIVRALREGSTVDTAAGSTSSDASHASEGDNHALVAAALASAAISDGARIATFMEQPYRESVAALAEDATHARALVAAGFSADVEYCLATDTVPVAVAYRSNRLELY